MPAPVIYNTTSILGYKKDQPFAYQPYATDVTSWAAVGLPTGLAINSSTGEITGSIDTVGVYVCVLQAIGESTVELPITIGIEDTADIDDGIGIDLDIDLRNGFVTIADQTSPDIKSPILFAKRGDVLFLDVGFWKDGTLRYVPITQMLLHVREFEGEETLVWSSGIVEEIATDKGPRYRIAVEFVSDALNSVLTNYEGDSRTSFIALAEIEWAFTHGSSTFTLFTVVERSSQTFRIIVDRDIIPNT